jgi:hypothetical protein
VPDQPDRPTPASAGLGPAAVDSDQTFLLPGPVVPATAAGARWLGSSYWAEVERSTRGTVRLRCTADGLELRLLGRGPTLLRFGSPQVTVSPVAVSCTYSILGGLLAWGVGGELVLVHAGGPTWSLRTSIRGFLPRLAARPGRPSWTGFLYQQVQARLHGAIGRRYVACLIRESLR